MKNLKRNVTLFLTLFIFTITCAFTFSIDKVYANSFDGSKSNIEYKVARGTSSSSSRSSSSSFSSKPSSSSFKPSSSGSKSYTKPKTTTTKPDSGSFTTKPKPKPDATVNESSSGSSSSTTKPKSSTTKPDSGNFSTKPNTKPNTNSNDKTESNKNKKYYDDDDYRGSSRRPYMPSNYGRGFFGFGGYNPFRYMGYRFGVSPMIMDIVMIITVLIVGYIIVDFIRSRRNR